MYCPPAFADDDPARIAALIGAHPLGLLISAGPAGLMANPVPFLLHQDGDQLYLRAHLARANPQLAELAAAPAALVHFHGPDAYVAPGFYPSKSEHGRVVPTWNYAAAQIRGQARLTDDPAFLRAELDALTAAQEHPLPDPWAITDAPAPYIAAQIGAIMGLEIRVEQMQGKFKLSQNKSEPDRMGVRAGLLAEGASLAALMPDT